MRILVIGTGAIGGYVGAKLALAGHSVTLVGRQPLVDAVTAKGLRLIEPEGQSVVRDCRAVTSLSPAFDSAARFDLALFTVKTYDTHSAIDQLRPYADRVDRFLSFQNGVSSEELLGEAFGRDRIMAGTILNPVSIREPGVVVLEKHKGGLGLSAVATQPISESVSQRINELADEMRRTGFKVRTCADYRAMKWSKLLLNLIGNASSAILDLTTMQTFADKRIFTIEIAALRETLRVARAEGIRWVGLPDYPVPLLVAALRWLPLPLLQPALRPLVASGRGSKMPSLNIDLSSGKHRTEIDELNGVVVRAGKRLNIPTPANELLVDTLMDLQSGRVSRLEWRYRADRLWAAYVEKPDFPQKPGS